MCQVFGSRKRSPKAAAAAAVTAAAADAAADAAACGPPSVVDYYITDGLYGSFNCVMYDHAQPTARPLRCLTLPPMDDSEAADAPLFPSTVFGPSCDGLDTVFKVCTVCYSDHLRASFTSYWVAAAACLQLLVGLSH